MIIASVVTVMRVDFALLAVAFGAAAYLLIGCSDSAGDAPGAASPTSGASPPVSRLTDPPGAMLVVAGVATTGGEGTRCWRETALAGGAPGLGCADYTGPVTNANPITLVAGEALTFAFEHGDPEELVLSLYEAPANEPPAQAGFRSWSIDPETATRGVSPQAPTRPGRYILAAFARWPEGDVTYGWYLEVE